MSLPATCPTPTLADELVDREAKIASLQDQIARARAELKEADDCHRAGLYGPSHSHLKNARRLLGDTVKP